jgi:DNA-nicking Smr family endonuclease
MMQKKQSNKATPFDYEDEFQLFRNAVQDITPFEHDKIHHDIKKSGKQINLANIQQQESVIDILSDEAEVQSINPLDNLSYRQEGIQKRVFKKLRRGQYITIDELDLHGLNVKQAKKLLLHFLEIALQVEGSCVSIIHGKGHRSGGKEAIIKRQTNHWLKQHPRVLAFHSAQPKDGGTGAVYVLLRRTPLPEYKNKNGC